MVVLQLVEYQVGECVDGDVGQVYFDWWIQLVLVVDVFEQCGYVGQQYQYVDFDWYVVFGELVFDCCQCMFGQVWLMFVGFWFDWVDGGWCGYWGCCLW